MFSRLHQLESIVLSLLCVPVASNTEWKVFVFALCVCVWGGGCRWWSPSIRYVCVCVCVGDSPQHWASCVWLCLDVFDITPMHWLESISFSGCRRQSPAMSYLNWRVRRQESPPPPQASCRSKTPSSWSSSEPSAQFSEWVSERMSGSVAAVGSKQVPRLWERSGGISKVVWASGNEASVDALLKWAEMPRGWKWC